MSGVPPDRAGGPPWGAFLQSLTHLVNATNAQAQQIKGNLGKPASGDLSGTYPGPILVVSTHLTAPLPEAQGGTGTTTGTKPSGTAGGDLSGTYPNPTVSKINGSPLGLTTPTAGNLMIGNGTTWLTTPISGDGTLSAGGVLTVTGHGGGSGLGPYASAALGQMPGTATNDNAAAGDIGEEIEASGGPTGLSTGTALSITSIILTAGDWDVWAYIKFTGGGTTTVTYLTGSISTTNNTLDASRSRFATHMPANATPFSIADIQFAAGQDRFSLASSTTVYLVARAGFAASTCSAAGIILARRRR